MPVVRRSAAATPWSATACRRGGHPLGRRAQGAGDVGRLALDPRVEDDDVGHRARGAGADDFHVVGHARHCRAARVRGGQRFRPTCR